MPTSEEPRQPTSPFDAALDATGHGIAVLPIYWPITPNPHHSSAQRRASASASPGALVCSCGTPDCPTPAAHPIKPVTVDDASVRVMVITQWFQTHPSANLATVAGTSFDVIDVPYQGKTAPLLAWLAAQAILPCPIIDTGHGHLRFPVRTPPPTTTLPDTKGAARRLAPGTLVLLPPGRHPDRAIVTWRRPFDARTLLLPDAARMLHVLAALPDSNLGSTVSGSTSRADIPGGTARTSGTARITVR